MADVTIGERIFKDSFAHDLQNDDLNHTTTFSTDFRLSFVAAQRDGTGGSVSVDVYFDSSDGALYDALIGTISLSGNGTGILLPDYDMYFKDGDEVRLWADQTGGANDIMITIHVVQE